MKIKLNLEEYKNSYYVLWDDLFNSDGFPLEVYPTNEELCNFIYEKTGEYLGIVGKDRAVASCYNYDNCVIFHKGG